MSAKIQLQEKQLNKHLPSESIIFHAIESALEQKAIDVVGLDLRGVSDVADFFLIASGTSDRHVRGIADRVRSDLKEHGETVISVNGYETGEWILLDYGNVVVHVFFEASRKYYDLDGVWAAAKKVKLTEELEKQAKNLTTGMY